MRRRQFLRSLALNGLATLSCFDRCAQWAAAQERQVAVPSAHDRIRAQAASAPLTMQFHGSTADECRAWQAEFRAKLLSLLQWPRSPEKWQVVREADVFCGDHVREELVLSADGHDPVPLYVLRPLTMTGPLPAVLCVHGHGPFGHDAVAGKDEDAEVANAIAESNYDYARRLVRAGFVTAAPCLTPFGRRLGDRSGYGKQDPCAVTFVRLSLLGRLLVAENLRDLAWTLGYLESRRDVKRAALGCVGLSYGGRMTMLLAATDDRVCVAVVSGALNVMQERITTHYGCGAQVIPGLLQYGDIPEIGSLIAPRPSLWEIGSEDKLIDPQWAEVALKRMRRAYMAYGSGQNLLVDRFEGGHQWNGREAVPLLRTVLGTS